MSSFNDMFDIDSKHKLLKDILNAKESVIKKKNSEIENRLHGKTNYYVIAVGNRSTANEEDLTKVRSYIYFNGFICFYSEQGKAYNKKEYIEFIDFVRRAVASKKYEWTDFWINKGQLISRDKSNNIHVDTEMISPISNRNRLAGNVSEMSLKLFYEFLRHVNEGNESKLSTLDVSYDKNILKDKVEKIVKSIQNKQLIERDIEIIVRTKIEGYNYIESYVKSVLNSDSDSETESKYQKINSFFNRVFFLETYGYIGVEE